MENLRKSRDKLSEKVRQLDVNWKTFNEKMREKHAVQKRGYQNMRGELVEALTAKQQAYEEALENLKRRAEEEKPLAIDIEKIDEETPDAEGLPCDLDDLERCEGWKRHVPRALQGKPRR